jgi:hypothetical protein
LAKRQVDKMTKQKYSGLDSKSDTKSDGFDDIVKGIPKDIGFKLLTKYVLCVRW